MLTAIVAASDDSIALADTLAALVPAAVNGLVRRVMVVTDGPAGGEVATLIEASGADLVIATGDALALWRTGLGRAAPGWRLCLAAGTVPAGEWQDVVARHVSRASGEAAAFVPGGAPFARLSGALLRLAGRPQPAAGLLTMDGDLPARGPLALLQARLDDRRPAR